MGSTFLERPCKPWLCTHRDTWRVNESPREAREHFASRLKGWVRFLTLLFIYFFFSKSGFIKETMNNSFMLVYFYFM